MLTPLLHPCLSPACPSLKVLELKVAAASSGPPQAAVPDNSSIREVVTFSEDEEEVRPLPVYHHATLSWYLQARGASAVVHCATAHVFSSLVIFCHGYLDSSTWYKGCVYRQYLVSQGYALASCEVEGHGRSDGLGGLIND